MDPGGTVGRIYREDYYIYTMLHTKYESSGPCGFGEEEFFMFFPLLVYGSYLLPWNMIRPGPKPNATFPPPQ